MAIIRVSQLQKIFPIFCNQHIHVILHLKRFMLNIRTTGGQICEPSVDGHFLLQYYNIYYGPNLSP